MGVTAWAAQFVLRHELRHHSGREGGPEQSRICDQQAEWQVRLPARLKWHLPEVPASARTWRQDACECQVPAPVDLGTGFWCVDGGRVASKGSAGACDD